MVLLCRCEGRDEKDTNGCDGMLAADNGHFGGGHCRSLGNEAADWCTVCPVVV